MLLDQVRRIIAEPQITLERGPVTEAPTAMCRPDRRIQRIALEPRTMGLSKCDETRAQVRPCVEPVVGGFDKPVHDVVRVVMVSCATGRARHAAIDDIVGNEVCERTARAQRMHRQVAEVAREDRAVVRRRIVT